MLGVPPVGGMGLKLKDLTNKQREEVLDTLRGI
jgi:hypothetical protein